MKVCPDCNSELLNDSSCGCCGFKAKMIDGFLAFAPDLAAGSDSFPADDHAILFQQENNCFWFSERNKLIIWALKKYFSHVETVMEIGCGTGYVLNGLYSTYPGIKYTGAEIYTHGLKFAVKRVPQANFIQMDARQIPFRDEFDIIGAFDVIEHVEEDQQVLSQMFKAVRPGGGIIITVPQHKWLWSAADELGCHKRRYTQRELGDKIAKSGFDVIKMVSFMSLVLPLIAVLRGRYLLCTKKMTEKSVNSELSINPALNSLFRAICRLEMRIIQIGFSFPAGGSLLCIAKKKGDA